MTDYVKSTNFASKDSLASGNPLKIVKGTEIDTEFNNIATAVATKADLASPVLTGTPQAPTATAGTNTTQLATTAFVQSVTASAIAAAVSTKADLASPALIGTPTAPTAAVGTNTTQVASTAFVHNEIMSAVYPVGSLYLNATNATNPATLLGFGTWTSFGAGRMPVGFNAADPLFDTAGETGGSKDATLVSHTHTTSEAGAATGSISGGNGTGDFGVFNAATGVFSLSGAAPNRPQGSGGIGSYTTENLSIPNHTHTNSTEGSSATNANLPPYITVYMWKRVS